MKPRAYRLVIDGRPVRDYPQRAAANGAAVLARARGQNARVVPVFE